MTEIPTYEELIAFFTGEDTDSFVNITEEERITDITDSGDYRLLSILHRVSDNTFWQIEQTFEFNDYYEYHQLMKGNVWVIQVFPKTVQRAVTVYESPIIAEQPLYKTLDNTFSRIDNNDLQRLVRVTR